MEASDIAETHRRATALASVATCERCGETAQPLRWVDKRAFKNLGTGTWIETDLPEHTEPKLPDYFECRHCGHITAKQPPEPA
jgi:transcription elongation factor Elf1